MKVALHVTLSHMAVTRSTAVTPKKKNVTTYMHRIN
jgi:hypothetical protein